MNQLVIVLTACINPGNMPYTALVDAEIRAKQYIDALYYYLVKTRNKIVFVENTNTDISFHFKSYIDNNRLEYIMFDGNSSFDNRKGKGYGEALILEWALKNSKFVNSNTYILKITGRLILKNISLLNKIYCLAKSKHTNQMALVSIIDYEVADSRAFIAHKTFFSDVFLKNKEDINDSKNNYFEHVLLQSIIDWKNSGAAFIPLRFYLDIRGISGSVGNVYKKPKCLIWSHIKHYHNSYKYKI